MSKLDINPPTDGIILLITSKPSLNPANNITPATAVSENGIFVNNVNAADIGVNIAPIIVSIFPPTLVIKLERVCQIVFKVPLTVPKIISNFLPKSHACCMFSLYCSISPVSIFIIWLACLYPTKSE